MSVKGRDVWYEDSDFKQILEATGKQLQDDQRGPFKDRLEETATTFLQEFGFEKRDPPGDVTKRLETIASKAKALVQLTKLPQGASARTRLHAQATRYRSIRVRTHSLNAKGETEEHIGPSQFPTVEEAIKAVEALALYARQAAASESRKKKPKTDKKRNTGNAARQKFINDLAGLWSDTFNELPGGSVRSDTQKDNGPFIRFAQACHAPLQQQFPTLPVLSENAARAHYRKTGEARLKRYAKRIMERSDQKKI